MADVPAEARDEQSGPSSCSSCNPLTILEALKAPKLSELTRIDFNPPPKGKRRARGEGSSEPNTVSAKQRVNNRLTV